MDNSQNEHRARTTIRSVYDLTMGILWSAVGLFLVFYRQLGYTPDFDPLVATIFGVACVCYGVFRFWRVYHSKKQ